MSLKLLSLIFCQILGRLALPRRSSSANNTEILTLRHEVAVLRCQAEQPQMS
ncbi:hypothetical protein ACFC1R_27510 [Kitasatospora sp. NPDC056138]|uniref:hypothetical protein n=1 Tax=Kitasatospora sp. NPDC056138 TaxID=3345724 RepID=UPI0035DBBFF8